MSVEYLTLNKTSSYKKVFALSNKVWNIVIVWDNFAKKTIGSQFVRVVDSISENIAEGFGRYGKKDKVTFYRIARASGYESFDRLEKVKRRSLIGQEEYGRIFLVLKELPREINTLSKFTNENFKT
jgi:four helix bundle protein